MKILAIDIETRPALVYTFSLFKPFIGIDQIVEPSRIICFSAQWHGSKKTMFFSEYHDGRKEMLDALHELLDQCHAVISYNGKRFDIPWITGELILNGYTPPSPFKHIDLYQVVKSNMRNISNKLDWVSQQILGERKVAHSGFTLWRGCMDNDPKSWATMKRYSIQDTKLMLPLYEKLLPWIPNHPSVAVYDGVEAGCTNCGSQDLERRGVAYTAASAFQQYRCKSCGKWLRGTSRANGNTIRSV